MQIGAVTKSNTDMDKHDLDISNVPPRKVITTIMNYKYIYKNNASLISESEIYLVELDPKMIDWLVS